MRTTANPLRSMRLFTFLVALSVALLLAPLAQAAISFVGGNGVVSSTNTSLTFTAPTGTTAGDLMLVQLTVRGGSATTFAAPSGWTLLRRDNNSLLAQAVYYRFATASEPASYSWTFSPSNRAVGAIAVYRGVDTTTPIDASGGQSNAASLSVTAPSITTTVANARLVGFFGTANGNAAFTPPSGMNERVDLGTSAGPNGATITVTDSTQAAAGATGTRTATATTSASNIGQLVALRPAVVVLTPGRFNAYETSTAAGAITGVIKTKIAGASFSLDLVALNSTKTAILTSFTGEVKVELLNTQDNSGTLDANNCRSSWSSIQTRSPNPIFLTADNGRKTVSFQENNAWRDVRVRVTHPATGTATAIGCSTDNFAIRPASLNAAATDADWQTAGTARALNNTSATGGNVHKAGRPFTLTATAVNAQSPAVTTSNYNGSPTVAALACTLPTPTCSNGNLTVGTWSGNGTVTSSTADYSEAGSFNLILEDQTFASVDETDSSTIERYFSSGTLATGRFVPNHFVLSTANTPTLKTFNDSTCATRSFTYIGQPFGYVTAPQALIAAQNSAGDTTTNYNGALWRPTAAYTYTPAAATLDTSMTTAPALASNNNGTGTSTVAGTDVLAYVRSLTTPQALFTANMSLSLSVADSSEAAVTGNGTVSTTTTAVFNGGGTGIAFDAGNEFRYGRLKLDNAHGSELLDLPVPLVAQYWNGTTFVANAADNCTSIAAANISLGNFQKNLSAGETTVSISGRFTAGKSNLKLSKPGVGNNGSVDLTVSLGATGANKTYLRGKWSGSNYDQNPSSRATFGIYKSADEFIYMREIY